MIWVIKKFKTAGCFICLALALICAVRTFAYDSNSYYVIYGGDKAFPITGGQGTAEILSDGAGGKKMTDKYYKFTVTDGDDIAAAGSKVAYIDKWTVGTPSGSVYSYNAETDFMLYDSTTVIGARLRVYNVSHAENPRRGIGNSYDLDLFGITDGRLTVSSGYTGDDKTVFDEISLNEWHHLTVSVIYDSESETLVGTSFKLDDRESVRRSFSQPNYGVFRFAFGMRKNGGGAVSGAYALDNFQQCIKKDAAAEQLPKLSVAEGKAYVIENRIISNISSNTKLKNFLKRVEVVYPDSDNNVLASGTSEIAAFTDETLSEQLNADDIITADTVIAARDDNFAVLYRTDGVFLQPDDTDEPDQPDKPDKPDKPDQPAEPENTGARDSVCVMFEANSEEAVKNLSASLSASSDVTVLHDISARWELGKMNTLYTSFAKDVSAYKYFNMLLYSDKKSNQKMFLLFHDGNSGGDNGNMYFRIPIVIDWEGTACLSLKLDSFSNFRNASWSSVAAMSITYNWGNEIEILPDIENSNLYIDKIWFSKDDTSPAQLAGAFAPNNFKNFNSETDVVRLKFSKLLANAENTDRITVTDGDTPVAADAYRAAVKDDIIEIKFLKQLENAHTYTIGIFELYDFSGNAIDMENAYSFTEARRENAAYEPRLASRGDKEITVSAEVPEGSAVDFYTVLYDKDNRIVDMKIIGSAEGNSELKNTISVESAENGWYIKAFSMTDGGLMASGSVLTIDEKESRRDYYDLSAETAELSVTDLRIDNFLLNIKGSTDPTASPAVCAVLKNDKGKLLYIAPVSADKNGKFEINPYLAESFDTGNYSLYLAASDAVYEYPKKLYLADAETKAEFTKIINGGGAVAAESAADILKILSDSRYEQLVPAFANQSAESLRTNIAEILLEQRKYAKYTDITDMAKKADEILAQMNKADAAALVRIISENDALIMKNSAYYDKYKKLGAKERNVICTELIKSISSFEKITQFRALFDSAVKNHVSTPEKTGGSGGGGGRVSTGTTRVSAEKPQESAAAFCDTDGQSAWAKPYIELLSEKKIISMPADRRFNPQRAVSREEFVKMLVLAIGADIENAAPCGFEDVAAEDWSYKYICAANSAGLVSGMGDNSFGKEKNISRQDAAVILERALRIRSISRSGETRKIFADDENISDYAKSAVYEMRALDIISGFGDNTFAPLENMTRAQAAKIVCEALKYME